jgi:hypothetical protein
MSRSHQKFEGSYSLNGILMHAPVKRQIITYNRVIMEAPSRNESDAFKDMSALP